MEHNANLSTVRDSQPLTSVIVPVYNMEKYLRQCLDSILCQTEPNIEIICVDDGSSDSSFNILEEYRARDSRVVVIQQENGGVSVARNAGVAVASGKYLFFADSDDELDPTLCEKTTEIAEKYDSQIVLTYSDRQCKRLSQRFAQFRRLYDSEMFEREHCDDVTPERRRLLSYFAGSCACWNCLYRRDFWIEHKFEFSRGVRIGEDVCANLHAFAKAGSFAFLKANLYHYRKREDSIFHKDRGKRLGAHVDTFKTFRQTRDYYQENTPYLSSVLFEMNLYAWRNLAIRLSREDYQIWKKNVRELVDDPVLQSIYAKDRLPFKVRQFWLALYGRSIAERFVAVLWNCLFCSSVRLENFVRFTIRPLVIRTFPRLLKKQKNIQHN